MQKKKNRVIGTLRGFIQTVFRIVLNLGYFYWQSVAKNLVSKMSPEDGKVSKIQLKTFSRHLAKKKGAPSED